MAKRAETGSTGMLATILDMDVYDMRFAAFFCAMMVYAFWGSPTPDVIGTPEIITGIFLVFSIGAGRVAAIMQNAETVPWRRAAQLLFITLLPLPLIIGQLYGNDLFLALRDIIPFFYMLLPIFLYDLMSRKKGYRPVLTILIAGTGVIFALRVLSPLLLEVNPADWSLPQPADPFYLANAPTVLFAGLFFTGMAGFEIYRADSRFAIPYAFLLLLIAFFPLASMALIMQRASMGMVVLSIAFLLVFSFYRKPERALLPFLTVVLIAALGWETFSQIFENLMRKTSIVGLNMRAQEAYAVLAELDHSVFTVIFGKGWGATFASPAVGGVVVNFTHNLFTTYWLKTGLLGVSMAAIYLYALGRKIADLVQHLPVIGLALFAPFIIDIFLYASFKSLDFGLILLLATLWADEVRRLKNSDGRGTKEDTVTAE